MTRLVVHATGPQSLVEDLGRRGGSGIGVGRSGAADRASLCRGNRALANPEHAAGVEVTYGGLEVEVRDEGVWFCVTGAPCEVALDGRGVGSHTVVWAPAGSRVRLGTPTAGLRSYLCVRGGVAVPEVMGSRSHDVLAGLGPAPLHEGAELPVGRPGDRFPHVEAVPLPSWEAEPRLRVVRGPRDGWLADADVLTSTAWEVTDRSNRIGMRLAGAALSRAREDELPSEGAWRGAIQVPPSGEPVLFLADHPVTVGYPVIGVVVDADVDRAAQVRPGERIHFDWLEAP